MRVKFTLSMLFVLSLFCVSSVSAKSPYDDSKFTTIFNGKNFDGWYLKIRSGDDELAKKLYAIEDGMIHVFNDDFPDKYDLDGKRGTHGLFFTDREYSRYIFRFDYKWGTKIANNYSKFQYDAGCYYHVIDDKIWPVGIEYQVRFNDKTGENHTGDIWFSEVVPMEWYYDGEKNYLSPENGGKLAKYRKGEHRAAKDAKFNGFNGGWNRCEIIVMGDEYTIHKLNGQVVNVGTSLGIKSGKIGLQSETAEVYYRNIRILEFDESIPMSEFIPTSK